LQAPSINHLGVGVDGHRPPHFDGQKENMLSTKLFATFAATAAIAIGMPVFAQPSQVAIDPNYPVIQAVVVHHARFDGIDPTTKTMTFSQSRYHPVYVNSTVEGIVVHHARYDSAMTFSQSRYHPVYVPQQH